MAVLPWKGTRKLFAPGLGWKGCSDLQGLVLLYPVALFPTGFQCTGCWVSPHNCPPLLTGAGYVAVDDSCGRVGLGSYRGHRAELPASCLVHQPQPIHRYLGKHQRDNVLSVTKEMA